jgi:hypothetical protein
MNIDLQSILSIVLPLGALMGWMWNRLDKKFDSIDKRFESMDKKFESRFESMDKKFESRFESMDKKFDSKFEILFSELKEIRKDINRIELQVGKLETRVEERTLRVRFHRTGTNQEEVESSE